MIDGCIGWFSDDDPTVEREIQFRYLAHSPGAVTGCVLTDSNFSVLPAPVGIGALGPNFNGEIHRTPLLECREVIPGELHPAPPKGVPIEGVSTLREVVAFPPRLDQAFDRIVRVGVLKREAGLRAVGTRGDHGCEDGKQ